MQLSLGTYWLSTEPDVIDWPKSKWYVTPCSSFADYSDLRALPPAPLDVHVNVSVSAASTLTALVNITNTAPHAVAFLVHLRLINDVNGKDVWPVFWSDNYFTLLPMETRNDISAAYNASVGVAVHVVAETFNSAVSPATREPEADGGRLTQPALSGASPRALVL